MSLDFEEIEEYVKKHNTEEKNKQPEQAMNNFNVLSQPWICPKCGSVYGPGVRECYRCNQPYKLEVTC